MVYITETMWKLLLDPNVASLAKLDVILNLLISLGARCPTEPTTKLVGSLVLLLSEPHDKLQIMPFPLKQAFHNQTKKRFHEICQNISRPPAHLAQLPKQIEISRSKCKHFDSAVCRSHHRCAIPISGVPLTSN